MRNRNGAALLFALLLPACQAEPHPPGPPAATAGTFVAAPPRALAARAGSFALSVDERGVPILLQAVGRQPAAPGATPESAARAHLARHAAALGVSPATLDGLELVHVQDLGPGGLLVRLRQRAGGLEIYRGEARLLLRNNMDLLTISAHLQPFAGPLPRASFRLGPADALAAALTDLTGAQISPGDAIDLHAPQGDYLRLQLAPGPIVLSEPARVKRLLFPEAGRLLPAYFVELFAGRATGTDAAAFRYIVSADDGRPLHVKDLTAYDSYNYRVWADPSGDKRPLDAPLADFTPHPTGMPDGTYPAFIPPNLVAMEAFNHNPNGMPDPWLPPNAMSTRGNNVDAYTDRGNPDGFSNGDLRATPTSMSTFDRTYDFNLEPNASDPQAMAGVTQLFYVTNWLHDYWYDSGFNEAAGNAQQDNFGRGGMGGDIMHAEAQDNLNGGARNNANMSTPDDGTSPRMQVYVWNGPEQRRLTLVPPNANRTNNIAGFGPASYNVTGAVLLADDGQNPASDACTPIMNGVSGKIALIDRGTCTFKQKVVYAQAAGAIGVIIADNVNAGAPFIADGQPNGAVNIPSMSISLADGNALKATLLQGPVTATLFRKIEPRRDGTLENTVIAHEWGHYLHHRLSDCSSRQCGALSEGWGDFVALHLLVRDGDNLDGAFAEAIYDAKYLGDSAYFGLRRLPYSVDFAKNGLTFRHISDGAQLPNQPRQATGGQNSEVHNAGEVWATMLFEAYVALIKQGKNDMPARSLDQIRRTFSEYLVAGLQLTPVDATYTEARDAILAAAAARSPADMLTLAQAFARRGAGTCAKSPPRDSRDFIGVVESLELKPRIDLGEITLDDSIRSCDKDGQLDGDERGKLTIHVSNGGPAPMPITKITVSSQTPGISFPAGATVDVPALGPLSSAVVTVEIALDNSRATMDQLDVKIQADNNSTCEGTITRDVAWRINYDEHPATSATDDIESSHSLWTPMGMPAAKVWARTESAALDHVWHATDYGAPSDTWLESPDLPVSAAANFTFSFSHRHHFEVGDNMGMMANFDGAVVEITNDKGASWRDLAGFAAVPYNGVITNVSGNPLADRSGFVDQNPAWPLLDKVTLNLGKAFAGQTVRVRFRVGTDQAAGDVGWDIDDVAFTGIDTTPFARLIDDAAVCAPMPTPDLATAASVDGSPPDGDAGESPMLPPRGCACRVGRPAPAPYSLAAAALLLAALLFRRRR